MALYNEQKRKKCKFDMSNISIICVTICVIFLAISSMALKIFPVDS